MNRTGGWKVGDIGTAVKDHKRGPRLTERVAYPEGESGLFNGMQDP